MFINTKLTPISLCTKNNYYLTRKETLTTVIILNKSLSAAVAN